MSERDDAERAYAESLTPGAVRDYGIPEVERAVREVLRDPFDEEALREVARHVLAALDARSGADTVKLAEVVRAVRDEFEPKCFMNDPSGLGVVDEVADFIERRFASGADRPEGGQT